MTAIDENTEATETTDVTETQPAEPAVKYPTYRELAFATWKLAYRLAYREDAFCTDGANEYLERMALPRLEYVANDVALQDKYLEAWFNFTNFRATSWTDEEDARARANLARRVRRELERGEPKSRETMNGWLTELGLEPFAPPAPPRHTGRYDVSYDESTEVNSARIQEALRALFPTLNVEVGYIGRRY